MGAALLYHLQRYEIGSIARMQKWAVIVLLSEPINGQIKSRPFAKISNVIRILELSSEVDMSTTSASCLINIFKLEENSNAF